MTSEGQKTPTHEEYMARAKLFGQHLAAEMSSMDPMIQQANKAFHFLLSGGKCLLCLDEMTKAHDKSQERKDTV